MVLAAAVKALQQAELLKERVLGGKDLLNDNDALLSQQQLIETYRKVLLFDLEYALDKKVEQDLWNHGIKYFISNLQGIVKDKKHSKRTEAQAMLNWCLENAAGFYLNLLQDICSSFRLDMPFRKSGSLFICMSNNVFTRPLPSKTSSYFICQHCLVHLGDIARYRNQNRQAETFYKYALVLSPTSAQPYNQLAILEASRGDKISAVFHYVRAVALLHPFPAAATNLSRALEKHLDDAVKIEGHGKLSSHEYLAAFLKLHGVLHSHTELDKAEKLVQTLITSLTAHIATESLSSWKLIQMVTINIFALQRIGLEGLNEQEMTSSEIEIVNLVTHLLAGSLNAFLLPVYTIKDQEPLLEYFAMPAIKLTLEWIRLQPQFLLSNAFTLRRQIWPSLCRFLNQLQTSIQDFQHSDYSHVPLPEDRDLQGFLPLERAVKQLTFHTEDLKTDSEMLNKLRAARLVDFGKWLTEQTPQLITMSSSGDGILEFETVGQPELPKDLLKEIEELSLGKGMSPVQSESSGSVTGASSPDSSSLGHVPSSEFIPEKRGILKSENVPDKSVDPKPVAPRGARNVALNSILSQKMTDDVKQVTFKTPSPMKDKEKPLKVTPALKKPTNQKLVKISDKEKADSKLDTEQAKKSTSELLNAEQKQQMLSALLRESNVEQPQSTSGLLNLNRQQQEMLSSSKQPPPQQQRVQTNVRPSPAQGQQRVAEKMEAARKEYEDAMNVLQQRKQELSEPNHYRGDGEQFRYDRMMPMSAPPPQIFMPVNQPPVMGMHPMQMSPMQPYAFKMQPSMMMPWQEPEPQPPMPPASWWAERMPPGPPHMVANRDPTGFRPPQQLNTYSLFSNPMGPEPNPSIQMPDRLMNQQSFWSGPGPSPLERLLEQQRNQVKNNEPGT